MRMVGILVIALVLFALPTGAAAYDRLVNPFQSCSLSGTPEYDTLQEAVNAASPGDQIGVCPGTYADSVIVTTPVTFTGIGSAVIDGSSLQGATCVDIRVPGVTVRYLVIQGCDTGIQVNSTDALIQNNQLRFNTRVGILIFGGNNIVQNNLVEDGGWGITVGGASDGTAVRNNTLRRNAIGVYLNAAGGALATKNSIQDGVTGIRADQLTHDSTISFNSVSFNGVGIHLDLIGSGDQVTRNVVTRNAVIDCRSVTLLPVFSKNTCGTESPAGAWD